MSRKVLSTSLSLELGAPSIGMEMCEVAVAADPPLLLERYEPDEPEKYEELVLFVKYEQEENVAVVVDKSLRGGSGSGVNTGG